MRIIDLRSDTVTKPSKEMREAIFNAEVGDDVYGEDPSVNALQEKIADLLGKEAALFVTSGTQGNQLCIKTHTQPFDELICEKDAHILNYESGSIAGLSHVQINPLWGNRGIFNAEQIEDVVRPSSAYYMPKTKLVCIENTHNRGGGAIFPIHEIQKIKVTCKNLNLKLHLDGARLWNASVATGIEMRKYASYFDSVSVCLSKGLGAPVGSVIAGTSDYIKEAHRFRKSWGGGMRQAGLLAAAGVYAIDHNFLRLKDDHIRAKYFANEIAKNPKIEIIPNEVETNIILFGVKNLPAEQAVMKIKLFDEFKTRVLFSVGKKMLVRAVTHLDINDDDIDIAIKTINKIFI